MDSGLFLGQRGLSYGPGLMAEAVAEGVPGYPAWRSTTCRTPSQRESHCWVISLGTLSFWKFLIGLSFTVAKISLKVCNKNNKGLESLLHSFADPQTEETALCWPGFTEPWEIVWWESEAFCRNRARIEDLPQDFIFTLPARWGRPFLKSRRGAAVAGREEHIGSWVSVLWMEQNENQNGQQVHSTQCCTAKCGSFPLKWDFQTTK